ncbi:hypothetical protein NPIL_169261 [Nephila pilipes]|uniref:Uncharacterized protein n=1 Tax=Nephila pilipes TaxID=299642 RepID=A0A8X6Q1J0_NEPPI|nr:hypothetical protein NPIL_169261 [Nephila pilipes]
MRLTLRHHQCAQPYTFLKQASYTFRNFLQDSPQEGSDSNIETRMEWFKTGCNSLNCLTGSRTTFETILLNEDSSKIDAKLKHEEDPVTDCGY